MAHELRTSGELILRTVETATLTDLKEFCAAARELGLGDRARLHFSRQGMLGPIVACYFEIPVVPAK